MKTLISILVLITMAQSAFSQQDPRINLVCEFEDYYDFEAFQYIDTLLYVANRYGLFVYQYDENDMDTPPVELVRYPTPGETESLLIVDTLCYLADGYAGLRILDISDIFNIREIGYCEDAMNGQYMQLQNDILYMACGSRFRSVDVSDPFNPDMLQTYNNGSDDFRIKDNLVYSSYSNNRFLDILDISDPSDIQYYGCLEVDNVEHPGGLDIHDDFLYYVTDDYFRIISIADPENLEVLYEGEYGIRTSANAVHHFNDHYLFMGSFRVWDVEDPTAPLLLFGNRIGMLAHWSEIERNIAITSNQFTSDKRGLIIYNIEDIRNIDEIQFLNSAMGLSDVSVLGNYLYVSSRYKFGSKLDIYDIENIDHPIKVGGIDSTEGGGNSSVGFDGITVHDTLAVLWAWDGRDVIQIYDLSDIVHPELLSEISNISTQDLVMDSSYI